MTDLTAKTDLTSGSTTEAAVQAAFGAMYDFISENAMSSGRYAGAIATGSLTPTKGFVVVDTEGSAASDNLDNILPTTLGAKVVILRCANATRVVTVRHNQTGTGQITLRDGASAVLDSTFKTLILSYNTSTTSWEEVWRSWGLFTPQTADKSAARGELGLGTSAIVDTGTSGAVLGLLSTANTFSESQALSKASADVSVTVTRTGTGASSAFLLAGSTKAQLGTAAGIDFEFVTNNLVRGKFASDGGLVIGSPTGGSKGPGTINAPQIFSNGTELTGAPTGDINAASVTSGSHVTSPTFRTRSFTIGNNAVGSFIPTVISGIILITCVGVSASYVNMSSFSSGGAAMLSMFTSLPFDVNTTTGTLTGTTGTSGRVTLRYDYSTNLMYIENRLGVTNTFWITIIG